jgi:acetyltransferase
LYYFCNKILKTAMINKQLLQPESIVVIGGSNNVHKPGGAVVRNLLNGGYKGTLRVVNPKEDEVQGIKAFHDARELPPTDLAILVVAAKYCPDYVELLAKEKQVRAFIIISAGFSEETREGAELEQRILDACEKYGCALIGPNCIGLLTRWHHSVFTRPIPHLNPKGVDFISGSGATAVFILESAVSKGLQFNNFNVGGTGVNIKVEKGLAGGLILFNNWVLKSDSYTFQIDSGYSECKVINCYTWDGDAVTVTV